MSQSPLDEFESRFDAPDGMEMGRSGSVLTLKYEGFEPHMERNKGTADRVISIGEVGQHLDVRPLWGEERFEKSPAEAARIVDDYC